MNRRDTALLDCPLNRILAIQSSVHLGRQARIRSLLYMCVISGICHTPDKAFINRLISLGRNTSCIMLHGEAYDYPHTMIKMNCWNDQAV